MQVNITIPDDWKEKLDKIARKEAYEQDKDMTYLDVIREAIRSHCKITDQGLFQRCAKDINYFVENYVKIYNPLKGLALFNTYDYQKRFLKHIDDNRFSIACKFRQGGFTTLTIAYALHSCIFKENTKILFISKTNRESITLNNIAQTMLTHLPMELRPIVDRANDHDIKFGNKSVISFGCAEAACGKQVNHLFIDEAAFIKNMEVHWKAIYPTISSCGKCTIVSTQSHIDTWFAGILLNAIKGNNGFKKFECSYKEHPIYKNEEWANETRKVLGEVGWAKEIECCFVSDK